MLCQWRTVSKWNMQIACTCITWKYRRRQLSLLLNSLVMLYWTWNDPSSVQGSFIQQMCGWLSGYICTSPGGLAMIFFLFHGYLRIDCVPSWERLKPYYRPHLKDGKRTVFSLCVSPHSGEGTPARSQSQTGEVPPWGPSAGYCFRYLGGTPARWGWGYPHPRPGLDGGTLPPPPQKEQQRSIWYMAGGMPLAFMQEDFLVDF